MQFPKILYLVTFFFRLIAASSSSIGRDVDTLMRFGRIRAHNRLSAAVAAAVDSALSSCVQATYITTQLTIYHVFMPKKNLVNHFTSILLLL